MQGNTHEVKCLRYVQKDDPDLVSDCGPPSILRNVACPEWSVQIRIRTDGLRLRIEAIGENEGFGLAVMCATMCTLFG